MDLKGNIKISGRIDLKLIGPDGRVKAGRSIDNLIVTAGKNALALWLTQATQADYFMRYITLGTGSTAVQASDTTMDVENATRIAGALSSSSNQLTVQATIPAGNATGAIVEAGLFSAVTSGTMFARQTFAVINKGSGDSLEITWRITLS